MKNLVQTVSLPPFTASPLLEWLEIATNMTRRAKTIIDRGTAFANRSVGDNRVHLKIGGEAQVPASVPGMFRSGSTRKILWEGSLEEREKGMFFCDREENDGDEDLTAIRPWSRTIPLLEGLVLPNPSSYKMSDGMYVDSDPRELPYQLILSSLEVRPASKIFAVKTRQGEGAMFCFPMIWGPQKDLYLVVTVNGRYGDLEAFFFQGDVTAYAKREVRRPRHHEVDEFFANRGAWGPIEIPTLFSHTYEGLNPAPPAPVELREVLQAAEVLKRTQDDTGKAGWLTNGG